MKTFASVLALSLCLSACALFQNSTTPQQQVYSATVAYGAALKVAVTYESLPRCGANAPVICSKAEIVAVIRKADTAAKSALDAAETTVRTPGFGQDVYQSAAVAATNAAQAFATIIATLK